MLEVPTETEAGEEMHRLRLRYLERYPLRTSYSRITEGVAGLVGRLRDLSRFREEPELLVDNTGVGRAVTDVLRDRSLTFRAITLTGGSQVARGTAGEWRVPKADVVDALVVPFQNETLRVAVGLGLWPTLRTELLNFRRKINPATAHASYEHWRETDHDDLVLAAALAAWGSVCLLPGNHTADATDPEAELLVRGATIAGNANARFRIRTFENANCPQFSFLHRSEAHRASERANVFSGADPVLVTGPDRSTLDIFTTCVCHR